MNSTSLNNAVSSFKAFLNANHSDRDDPFLNNIKEDMRHFLRLYKFSEDDSMDIYHLEIIDSMMELYEVISIELNAVDIHSLTNKDKEKDRNSNDKKDTNFNPNNSSNSKEIILTSSNHK